ncbi:MAG: hypothetical protein ABIG63_21685, partial [Chloroflexota bacterium]
KLAHFRAPLGFDTALRPSEPTQPALHSNLEMGKLFDHRSSTVPAYYPCPTIFVEWIKGLIYFARFSTSCN